MMLFRQLFDKKSCTYTYFLGQKEQGSVCLIDPVRDCFDLYLELLNKHEATLACVFDTHTHADNYISEGGGENIFLVKDNTLYTPKLGNILAGITRDTVFKIAQQRNIPIIETSLTQADVFNADEAFFTGTAAEISPIRSLDDKVIGEDKLGAITHLIQQAYADIIHGIDADFSEYLTYIE